METVSRWARIFIAPVLVLLVVGLITNMMNVQAHTGLHNATQKKDVTAWGSWAYINWTNPDLDGGSWVYHRTAVLQWSPWRFVEFGWQKTSSGVRGLIVYEDGSGAKNQVVSISAATHRYSMQYDPNTDKYWFYLDGSNVWNVDANFSSGDAAMAGGEVASGVEDMGHTHCYDLRYLKKNDGTFSFVLWNGYEEYAVDDAYFNTDDGSNAFYDDGVGHDGE